MYVVTLARKPLSRSTVAAVALEFGTGALAIDASRIGLGEGGRWPPNVILSHLPGCRVVGHKVILGDGRAGRAELLSGTRPGGFGGVGTSPGSALPNAGVYGDEQVAVWRCEAGCPVLELDTLVGTVTRFYEQVRRSSPSESRSR